MPSLLRSQVGSRALNSRNMMAGRNSQRVPPRRRQRRSSTRPTRRCARDYRQRGGPGHRALEQELALEPGKRTPVREALTGSRRRLVEVVPRHGMRAPSQATPGKITSCWAALRPPPRRWWRSAAHGARHRAARDNLARDGRSAQGWQPNVGPADGHFHDTWLSSAATGCWRRPSGFWDRAHRARIRYGCGETRPLDPRAHGPRAR
jgi:hypothetical protein